MEIRESNRSASTVEGVVSQTQEDIQELEGEIAGLEPETEELRKQIDGRGDTLHSFDQQVQNAKDERDRLMDQRK